MWRESSKRHFFYSFCCASLLGVVAAAAAPSDAQQSSSSPEPEPWFSFGFKFYLLNASMWAIACYFIYQQFQRLFGTVDSSSASSSSASSASAAITKPTTSAKPSSSTTQNKEEVSDLAAKVESLVATLKQKSVATEKDEKRQQKLVSALQSLRATTDSALRTLSVNVKEEADKEKAEEKQKQQSQQTKGEQKEQEKEKEKDERTTEKEYYDEEEGDDEDDDEDEDEDDEDDDDEEGEGSSLESSMGERSDLGYIPDTSKSGAGAGGKARGRNRVPSAKRRRRRWRRKQRLPNEENGVSSLGATAKGAGVVGVGPEEEGASASEEISDDVEGSGLVVPPRLKKKGLRRRRNVAKKGTIGGRGQDEGEADSEGTRTNSGDADSDNDVVNNEHDNGDTGTSSATLSMTEREETLKSLQLPDEEADLSSTADDFSSLRASLDGLNFSGGWSLIEKDSTASKDEPNDTEKKETSDESNDDSRNNYELRSLKESLLSFEKSDDEGDSTASQDSSLDSLKAQLGDFPSFDSLSLGQVKREEEAEEEEGEGENTLSAPFSLGGEEEGGGGGMFDDAFEQLLKAKQQANKTSVKNVADEVGLSTKDGVKQTNFSKREEGALLRDWAVKEDENKAGLRKAKKAPMAFGSKSKKQSMMEDAHTIHIPFFGDASQGLVAVLDGHAGPNAAQAACSLLPKELEAKLMEATMANGGGYPSQDLSAVMVAAFTAADRQMEEFEFEGCTATAVFMWHTADGDRYLQAANVGDSAAFLRRNGQAVKLTYDHKVTDSRERERMTSEGVEITPGKTRISGLAVSRALGDHFVKQNKLGMTAIPHVSPGVQLTDDDDILIVASDGLWDVIDGQAAMDLIKDLPNAEAMAEQLMSRALGDPACKDNITIIVVLL